jgi:hypothetical protein
VKVSIKDLAINMDLGNNGVTFDVYDNDGKFLGDLRLGKGTVEWCKGKTQSGNGVKVKWNDLIQHFESGAEEKKPAAKKAARKKVAE